MVDLLSQMIQTPLDFARLALDEEVNSLVLVEQHGIQFIFKGVRASRFSGSARDGDGLCFGLGGPCLDQVLDFVVVDIICQQVSYCFMSMGRSLSHVPHCGMERCWSVSPYFICDYGMPMGRENGRVVRRVGVSDIEICAQDGDAPSSNKEGLDASVACNWQSKV